jgi:hypothetical protein
VFNLIGSGQKTKYKDKNVGSRCCASRNHSALTTSFFANIRGFDEENKVNRTGASSLDVVGDAKNSTGSFLFLVDFFLLRLLQSKGG